MKEIIIEVDEKGEIIIETKGFKGKSCIEESQFIKDLIGEGQPALRQLKATYYQKEDQKKYIPLCG